MIDPKELRIGNLIWFNDAPKKVGSTHVIALGDNLIYTDGGGAYPNECEGIKLTEERLLRMEYEKKNEDLANDNIDYAGKSQYWVQHQIDFDDYVLYGRNNSLGISLKYVHTFQNLIFALTQKELEIKG